MNQTIPAPGDVETIVETAREAAKPHPINPAEPQRHAFVVPAGARLEVVDPDDKYLTAPRRLTGTVKVEDPASFLAYVERFYDAERTTAWVDMDSANVVAVLNDAKRDEPAWRDHRAVLQLAKTPEWTRWRNGDAGAAGRLMSQEAFARHIETSELDIVVPSAAELLELAQTFYAKTDVEFRSSQRLTSGEVQITYVEETTAGAGRNGEVDIPTTFELLIAPFHGEDKVPVQARLRYRVQGGNLSIGYELVRPDEVEREVLERVAANLRTKVERVYLGAPAGPAS